VSGVTDEHNAPAVPLLLIHPLDRRAVDLLVALQGGEELLNRLGKPVKATPQAFQPAAHVIVEMRLGNMAKSVSVPAADRTETEEAPISEEEPQARQLGRPHRHNAAPSNMTGADGRIRPESQFANTGRYAVGTDHKIVSAAGPVAETDRNTMMILQQRSDRDPQPARHCRHANQQGLLQLGACYSDERPDTVPEISQINVAKQFTLPIAKNPVMQGHSAIRNGAIQFERTQGAHCVRLNGHSGTEGLPSRITFY
jgi:hypothetical protein